MLQELKANPSESLGLKFRELRRSVDWKFIRSEYKDYLKSLSDQLRENLNVSIYKGTSNYERPLPVWCVGAFVCFLSTECNLPLLLFSLKSAC